MLLMVHLQQSQASPCRAEQQCCHVLMSMHAQDDHTCTPVRNELCC